jgi:hypothetical protein
MIKNIRISEAEALKLLEWINENNGVLKETTGVELISSEVVHLLILIGLERLKVDKTGNVYFI